VGELAFAINKGKVHGWWTKRMVLSFWLLKTARGILAANPFISRFFAKKLSQNLFH